MIKLKIENLKSIEEIKKSLSPLEDESDFKWLLPIINFSLDESVIIYLNNYVPNSSKFVTLDLKEHITEATNLINNCTQKRNEIFEIETQALTTAIEYIQLINTIADEEKLSNLNLKASFNQSKELNIDDYNLALKSKFDNLNFALQTKLSIHNQKGNPLNYGERIKYLRKIYSDNIKNIYERLIAIKRTLKYSFNQETRPLPNYIEVANNLDKLIWWIRDVVYTFESLEQSDYMIQKSISLSNYALSKGLNPTDFLNEFRTNGSISINVSEQDFISNGNKERIRILGVGCSVIGWYDLITTNSAAPSFITDQAIGSANKSNNDTKRENMLYYCEVNPPEQNPKIDLNNLYELTDEEESELINAINKFDKSKILKNVINDIQDIKIDKNGKIIATYKPTTGLVDNINFPNKLIFGELQPIHKTSIYSYLNFSAENSIKNASPEGSWKINLKNVSFEESLRTVKLEGVKDFVITFKLSVRKF